MIRNPTRVWSSEHGRVQWFDQLPWISEWMKLPRTEQRVNLPAHEHDKCTSLESKTSDERRFESPSSSFRTGCLRPAQQGYLFTNSRMHWQQWWIQMLGNKTWQSPATMHESLAPRWTPTSGFDIQNTISYVHDEENSHSWSAYLQVSKLQIFLSSFWLLQKSLLQRHQAH